MSRNKVKSEKHLDIYGGLSGGIGMKTYSHGPKDFAKILKPRYRVGVLDLPERRKRYVYQHRQEEEEVESQMLCPCGRAIESRTHIV